MIGPREPVADIVPTNPRLLVEASVRTDQIADVWKDGRAKVRFPAFKSSVTPLVEGSVVYISPDRVVVPATRTASYAVHIELDPSSLDKAGNPKIQSGMPAEVYIEGKQRTALVYLLEPLTDALRKSGRER